MLALSKNEVEGEESESLSVCLSVCLSAGPAQIWISNSSIG